MRIAVLGTGALGCVFSAQLAGFAQVWMLGTWVDGLAAVERNGIVVEEPDGSLRTARVFTSGDPARVPPCDLALILVKSYQTDRAAAWAATVLNPAGVAVSLQNGLDNGPKIAAAVGEGRAVLGVTYSGATLLEPGRVRLVAKLATYVERPTSIGGHVDRFLALLRKAGMEAHAADDVQGRLWGKAVANAAINPLTALWRVPNGGVCKGEGRHRLMATLAEEAANVALAGGKKLPFQDAVAYVESVCRATAANHSSMLQDVERDRPTEIDSINGVIVAEGRHQGIPTPFNEMVCMLVRGLYEAE
jgi:2-dehydropantoate 2-reductase